MRRLVPLLSLLLLAIWLPATQHCALEAAGLFAGSDAQAADSGCCKDTQSCADDGCDTLEGPVQFALGATTIKPPSAQPLAVLPEPPAAIAAPARLEVSSEFILRERQTRPRDWVVTWHFVRRAAPAPRAPAAWVA